MAIASNYTFDYGVTLGRLPAGCLGGIGAVRQPRSGYPGLLGCCPRDGALELMARQQDGPLWWMSRKRRAVLAAVRRALFPVGWACKAFVRERDALVIAREMNGQSNMPLTRAGRAILGVGGAGAIHAFFGSHGLESLGWALQDQWGTPLRVTVAGEERAPQGRERVEAGPMAIQLRKWDADAFTPSPFLSIALMNSGAEAVVDECARELLRGLLIEAWA